MKKQVLISPVIDVFVKSVMNIHLVRRKIIFKVQQSNVNMRKCYVMKTMPMKTCNVVQSINNSNLDFTCQIVLISNILSRACVCGFSRLLLCFSSIDNIEIIEKKKKLKTIDDRRANRG